MEDVIRIALQRNVNELCFTDHVDIDYPHPDFRFDLNYEDYLNTYKELRLKYQGQIVLKFGVELGLQPHIKDQNSQYIKHRSFDFVIGSVHGAQKQDLYTGEFMAGKDKHQAYLENLEEGLACIQDFPDFNVIGHLDLIRRYGNYSETAMEYKDFKDIVNEIFSILIPRGQGIEINTSGIRYNLGATHPTFDYIKAFKQAGGEVITVGSDSHRPEDLISHFDTAYDMLTQAGFKYITTFDSMKPNFIKI